MPTHPSALRQARIAEAEQAAASVEDPTKLLDLAEAYGVLPLGLLGPLGSGQSWGMVSGAGLGGG